MAKIAKIRPIGVILGLSPTCTPLRGACRYYPATRLMGENVVLAEARGRESMEAFGRRIPRDMLRLAVAVVLWGATTGAVPARCGSGGHEL